MEVDKKEKQKELDKLQKEKLKEAEKLEKEKLKEVEKQQKEKVREAEKQQKEKLKQFEKQRVAMRKEMFAEVRKNRGDVSAVILQNFDREEEVEDGALPVELAGIDLNSNQMVEDISLKEVLQRSGVVMHPSLLNLNNAGDASSWDEFFFALSGINLLRQYIGLDRRYTYDEFSKIVVRTLRDKTDEPNNLPAGDSNMSSSYFEAELDRIELSLTKILLPELHTLLELDERETDPTRRKDKRQGAVTFPLNQLTWAELARMVLLNFFFNELGRGKDDRQHCLRGSKLPNFRIAKNVIRNIRYRWYMRGIKFIETPKIEDVQDYARYFDHLALIQRINNQHVTVHEQHHETKPYPNIFDSEVDMAQKLNDCVASADYPEVYKRCCKVILRLLEMRSIDNFMWEVDKEVFPDYYSVIKKPTCLSSIASRLVERGYGYDESKPITVADAMVKELKQMFINCVTYNTEYQTIVAQATKLYLFTHRIAQRWIYDSERPPLEQCSDSYCMLTGTPFSNSSKAEAIRCGKCSNNYHYESVLEIVNNKTSKPSSETVRKVREYCLEPTSEMFAVVNEEWHCPFCLQEDFVLCQRKLDDINCSVTEDYFYINEWGMSSALPWVLSSEQSTVVDEVVANNPKLAATLNAIKILSNQRKTSYTSSGMFKFWTASERIQVMSALLNVLQSAPKASDYVKKLHDDCGNILRMCAKTTFREADFMTSVRDLSGDDAVKCCRGLLDGIESTGGQDSYLQSFLTEGRCLICNGSTYEEDENEEDRQQSNVTVILCDGCNCEAHLRCLELKSVRLYVFVTLMLLSTTLVITAIFRCRCLMMPGTVVHVWIVRRDGKPSQSLRLTTSTNGVTKKRRNVF